MQLRAEHSEPLHLTYCTNVHRGDTLSNAMDLLPRFAPLVKSVAPSQQNRIAWGLFLGCDTVKEMDSSSSLTNELSTCMEQNGTYALTMNAFPMSGFHEAVVKRGVYQPDWHQTDRVQHTLRTGRILANLPTRSSYQSISTMPGSFKAFGEADLPAIAHNLVTVAQEFARIESETGRRVVLAVEPEPGCTFETTDEWITFFKDHLLPAATAACKQHDVISEELIRRHIGICFDCCHQSVEFEDVADSLRQLISEGVSVAKIQLSTALRCENPARSPEAIHRLTSFDEPRYLHQVGAQARDGSITVFEDLSEYLQIAHSRDDASCRVHFHVPIFEADLNDGLQTTRPDLEAVFRLIQSEPITEHLEIETYSFDVLPNADGEARLLSENIAQEYRFALSLLAQP